MESVKPRVLAPGRYAIDVKLIPPHNRNNKEVHLHYLKHLKESVETLRMIVEEAKVERPLDRSLASACLYTKHSQELLEYQVTFEEQCNTSNSNTYKHVEKLNTQKTNIPVPPSTGVNYCTNASGSQPRSNTKKNRISPAKGVNKKKVEEHPRTNKSNLRTMNRVDSSSSSKRTVVQIILWYLDSGCSKHMMGGHSRLKNFMNKFTGTVRFRNDHFGAIMGYGDYVIGDSVISRIHLLLLACQLGKSKKHTHKLKIENTNVEVLNTLYLDLCGPMQVQMINGEYILVIIDDYSRFTWVKFLRSKDETPEVVIKFLKQIQVGLNKTVRYIRTDNGTEFVNKDLTEYYERVGIFHPKTILRTPQQNNVVERRNRTLVEAARIMLIFSKAPMFLWAEAVATAFFGAFCYPTNDSEDLGKLQPTVDIGIFIGYALSQKGPAPTFLTPRQIISGLVPNPIPAAPYVPPTNKELEILFQPMFDEYLEPPHVERPVSPALAVPIRVNSAGTPSSTTIGQDAPSPSHSPSSWTLQCLQYNPGVSNGSTS
ncbi:retrovirus-related pol polyprotein from transposon TNT 1-94 [Tanacetum coccineum]